MARFESIQKGKKARKTVDFPAPLGAPDDYTPIPVDFIVLAGTEEDAVLQSARLFAEARGVREAKEGDPHYDLGLMVYTLAHATVDHAVPGSFAFFFEGEGKPGDFDAMAGAILEHLDRERITYLYQQQQIWQEECSPWGKGDTEQQILAKVMSLRGVSDPGAPFRLMRLATVGSLLLTTVNQLAILLWDKSPPGSGFGSSTSSTTKNPEELPA